ncbi:MAG: hypothetical protein FJ202_04070 [Gemmatimonadetes bacterium]|nr:hypothetical protein [Gemmatimonadota bacterium]
MLLHPEQVERVVEEVGRLDAELDERPAIETMDEAGVQPALRDPVYASIFRALADGAVDAEGLGERLTLLENREVEALRSEPAVVADPGRTIADAVAMLRERLLRERLDEHARMLPLAAEQDKDALLRLGVTLQKELRAVGKREWRSVRRRDW